MYKIAKILFVIIFTVFTTLKIVPTFALEVIDQGHLETINKDIYKAVGSEDIDENENALRQGAHLPVDDPKVNNAILAADGKILDYDSGAFKTFKYIRNIVNYVLGFLGIVALFYLLYHGFIIVTTTEENKHEIAMKSVKTAAIAIGGIGVAWFLVSFIYYVIWLIYKDVPIIG